MSHLFAPTGRWVIAQGESPGWGRRVIGSQGLRPGLLPNAPLGRNKETHFGTINVNGGTNACSAVSNPTMLASKILCPITALKMSASLPT